MAIQISSVAQSQVQLPDGSLVDVLPVRVVSGPIFDAAGYPVAPIATTISGAGFALSYISTGVAITPGAPAGQPVGALTSPLPGATWSVVSGAVAISVSGAVTTSATAGVTGSAIVARMRSANATDAVETTITALVLGAPSGLAYAVASSAITGLGFAGATVAVMVDGVSALGATVSGSGAWSILLGAALSAATSHLIVATQTVGGVTSALSAVLIVPSAATLRASPFISGLGLAMGIF